MNENFSNQPNRIPYMGGDFVTCPRCSNVVNNRYCDFCGLDLSLVYSKEVDPNEQKQYSQQSQTYNQQQYGQQPFASMQQQNIHYPYNNMYNYTQKRPKKRGWIFIIIAVVVIIGFYAIAGSTEFFEGIKDGFFEAFNESEYDYSQKIAPPVNQDEYYYPGGVSAQEFEKLKKGMLYAEVSSIIGGDGEIYESGTNLQDEPYYTYGWIGENNPDAIVFITITNDQVTDILTHGEL